MISSPLKGGIFGSGLFGREATGISEKKVPKKPWTSKKDPKLMQKTFPITAWDKHYSSLGGKRAAVSMTEKTDKEIFKTKTKRYPTKTYEMSKWNEQLAILQKKALISTDDSAKKIADKQLYGMMLQDTQKYSEMGPELSLRDLNRYQFRHNRSTGEVPVETAGAAK
jgi:hypothetical protein